MSYDFEIAIIGSGPGGQRAAVQAAKLGKKVLLIEADEIGGNCLHLGTVPSKTLREAVLDKSSRNNLASVMKRKSDVISAEAMVVTEQIRRNNIRVVYGRASFVDTHSINVKLKDDSEAIFSAGKFVIATGTRPRRPSEIDFNHPHVFDSDSILEISEIPKTMCIMGAGVVGCEYVSIFAEMGCQVTLVDKRNQLLQGVDREVVDRLTAYMKDKGVKFILGPDAIDPATLQFVCKEEGKVCLRFQEKDYEFDALLYCMGRTGNVESLNLSSIGIQPTSRGLIEVNEHFQTKQEHIYAVGDIIGHPALAASAFAQGRIAAAHAFGLTDQKFPKIFPYGIYTIPEISSVGAEEAELIQAKVPFITGYARYSELARGKIVGDEYGLLKLIFHEETKKLLGAHVIGTSASELIHIAQVAMWFEADVQHLLDFIFNYPTLAEAYKVASLNAYNKFPS
ncbi:Si-specific NAD(P)(+) transhydrogenase [bacterium]|nr:Si-specific NAD(P)(+) transhydrogenase [bacterium]